MANFGPVPEKIVERKIIVYKSRIDPKDVRVTAEKMKTSLFRTLLFMKPKPEEVQIISMDKYFEPYVVADGHYCIDYSKNWTRTLQVDETMQDLTIFGGNVKPASLKDHLQAATKIVKLTGEGRYKIESKARLIFDIQWNEVGLEQLPFVPFEEQPEKILNSDDRKIENPSITTGKEVEILKSKLVNRPKDILCIHDELFTVSERAVIYKPMYRVTVQNLKANKKATLIIDAISGKTTSRMHQTATPKQKLLAKKTQKLSVSQKTGATSVSKPITKKE